MPPQIQTLLILAGLALVGFIVLLVVIRQLRGRIIRGEQARALQEAEPRLAQRLAKLGAGSAPELAAGTPGEEAATPEEFRPGFGRRLLTRIADADPRRGWRIDVAAALATLLPVSLAVVLAFPSLITYVPATPSPSPSPVPTASPTPSPQPTTAASPTFTPTPMPSPSPSPSPSPTPRPTPRPTARPTAVPTPRPPVASFTYSVSNCFVDFVGHSTYSSSSYSWTFGSSGGAIGRTPGWLFPSAKAWTVTLKVSAGGKSGTVSHTVTTTGC